MKGSKLHMRVVEEENIRKAVNSKNWCRVACLIAFTMGEVKELRDKLWVKKYSQRVKLMLEKIKTYRLHVGNCKFVVGGGVEVCSKCFCSLINIGQKSLL